MLFFFLPEVRVSLVKDMANINSLHIHIKLLDDWDYHLLQLLYLSLVCCVTVENDMQFVLRKNRKKQSASDPNSRLSMNKVHVYVQMCCPHCCFGPLHTHVRRYLLSVHTTHTHSHTHTHTLTHTHTHWQMWAVNPFT